MVHISAHLSATHASKHLFGLCVICVDGHPGRDIQTMMILSESLHESRMTRKLCTDEFAFAQGLETVALSAGDWYSAK